jgi:hypothetical protein
MNGDNPERSQYHLRKRVVETLKQRLRVECLIHPLTRVVLIS